MKKEKNPYVDKNGRIRPGLADKAYIWARTKELEKRSKLPLEEQEKAILLEED